MRRSVISFALVVGSALGPQRAAAQGRPAAPPLRVAASSFATVEVRLNSRPIGREWYEEDAALTDPSRIATSGARPSCRRRGA